MSGILYGVSVGPGDPQLITLGALKIIEHCRVIAVPRTKGENSLALSIAKQAADMSGKEFIFLDFPMTGDRDIWVKSHENAADIICERLFSGEDVAMLCLGDISVYSTFSYTAELVEGRGAVCRRIPGVTSFCAAAAACGIPLAGGSEPLIVIPASAEDAEELIERRGTKVIMKSGRLSDRLRESLNNKDIHAVSDCGLPEEKIYTSLDDIPEKGSYFTLTIVK
ncbi:MAG: precorrin-2 C(20)-methyltransferase [Oscillospiraceae bacterium]|nr:precorrin-2 C(20)-methyltransferase [Oscillospiraceae bacterium]